MREIAFSVPVSGVIRLDGNSITVIVNRASTNVLMEEGTGSREHTVFEPGVSMFDILLESAREFIRRKTITASRSANFTRLPEKSTRT
jgi:hypothetical protein